MLLQISPDRVSPQAVDAILKIEQALDGFEPADQLVIAGECVLGILRDLRSVGKNDPARQPAFDAICSDVQTWLRQKIEEFRFEKSH